MSIAKNCTVALLALVVLGAGVLNAGRKPIENRPGLEIVQEKNVAGRIASEPPLGWSAQTSGVATALASVDAVSPNVAWAAGNGGVVLRTTNGGVTWTSVGGGLIGIEDIYAIDAFDENLAVLTTTPSTTTFIYRTTNGGASWTQVYSLAGGFMDGLHMFNATDGIAMGDPVGGTWVVARTTDGGASWARIATEPVQVLTEAGWNNSFHVIGTDNIWFGTSATRVYRSTDAGATWSSSATTGTANSYGVWFNDVSSGVAVGTAGVRTTNGGATWSSATIPGSGAMFGVGGAGDRDFWVDRGTTVYHSINFGTSFVSEFVGTGTQSDIDFVTVGDSTWGWVVSSNGTIAVYHNAVTPPPLVPVHDIGITSLQNRPADSAPATQLGRGTPPVQTVSKASEPLVFVENAPVNMTVLAQNFGNVTETSYQVAWTIDGGSQTPVNNSDSLTVGDNDSLTLTWAVPTVGLHAIRAWTVLGTDTTRSNDSSVVFYVKVLPANVVFFEGFNGGTFPPAGWITVNRDGGGSTGPWFAGNSLLPALEGNGYAADNYQSANGFYIDDYLISPNTGGAGGTDSLSFWLRGIAPNIFPDSIQIRLSTTGTDTSNFTTMFAYVRAETAWTRYAYLLPNSVNRYVAFRYLHHDGGINGDASDYFGLDDVRITRYGITTSLDAGWNLISNPVTASNDSVKVLFPASTFPYGFRFAGAGGYQQDYTMENGVGFWAKFASAGVNDFEGLGTARNTDSLVVVAGWNIVGSVTGSVDTLTILTDPGIPLAASHWFKYQAGYPIATTIEQGKGYWKKASRAGKFYLTGVEPAARPALQMNAGVDPLDALNTLTITDSKGGSQTLYFGSDAGNEIAVASYEMPPVPPAGAFDARFSAADGGYMVRTHPAVIENIIDLPVAVQSVSYPLTVSWKIASGSYTLSDAVGGQAFSPKSMTGEGSVQISHDKFTIKVLGGAGVPTEFALSQNYPNPFNPTTNISFALPVQSKVTIDIYNVLGQKIRTLLKEDRQAGYHVAEWNGTGNAGQQLGSGVYFLQLSATGTNGKTFSEVRKLMMLK